MPILDHGARHVNAEGDTDDEYGWEDGEESDKEMPLSFY
jgi:hypothetical protein